MKRRHLLLALIPLILVSCLDKIDMNNLDEDIRYRGKWTLPIVNTNLSLENILVNDSTFTVDPDGGLRIIYSNDSLFAQSTADFAKVEDQPAQQIPVVVGMPSVNFGTELSTIAGAKLKEVTIFEGTFNWSFDNPGTIADTVEFAVLNAYLDKSKVDTAKFQLISSGNGMSSGVIDISGLYFDFREGTKGFNALKYRMQILSDVGQTVGTQYDLEVQLKDVVVKSAKGYFGNKEINLPSQTIRPEIESFEKFLNGLYLNDPRITLKAMGNIGLPVEFSPKLDGFSSANKGVTLQVTPQSYNGPINEGDWDTSNIVVDRNTSNIIDFIANVPQEIVFSGKAQLNPLGETGVDNFVTNDGLIQVGLEMDLPLELRAKNMLLEMENINVNIDIEEQEAEYIKDFTLFFKVTNGFPFSSDLMLFFMDSTDVGMEKIDSVKIDELFNAAPVDGSGRVTQPTVSRTSVNFTNRNIMNLIKSDRLTIQVLLNSYDDGNTMVKLYNDYDIQIALAIEVELNRPLNQ